MGNALTAKCAFRFCDFAIVGYPYRSSVAGTVDIPNIEPLYFIANLHAAHALDTLGSLPNQRQFKIPAGLFVNIFIGLVDNTQIVGNLLQGTVAALDALYTFAVMIGKNQFHVNSAHFSDSRTVGENLYSFFYLCIACSYQFFHAYLFYKTDSAGADFVNIF